MRLALAVEYAGFAFCGFQSQPSRCGVQDALEAAIGEIAGHPVGVVAAGRTDAGVHALAQVASFDLPNAWEPGDLQHALNAMLPGDLRVCATAAVSADFCARRRARGKLYRYVLDTGAFQLPGRRRCAAYLDGPLDEQAVRVAAELFLGTRDFASLASAGGSTETTVRTIRRSEAAFEALALVPDGRTLTYEVEGSGFLRKMVRSIVGGLIAVGRGLATRADLERALGACDRRAWPAPAVARGLTLVRVDYANEGD
jgi:tRNA pseudouridine38-40 synthase